MENSKKYGESSFSKHLRNKKGKWTKWMANSKSRSKDRQDHKKGQWLSATDKNAKVLLTEADRQLFFKVTTDPPR